MKFGIRASTDPLNCLKQLQKTKTRNVNKSRMRKNRKMRLKIIETKKNTKKTDRHKRKPMQEIELNETKKNRETVHDIETKSPV